MARFRDSGADARVNYYLEKTGATAYQVVSSYKLPSGFVGSSVTQSIGTENGIWQSFVVTRDSVTTMYNLAAAGSVPKSGWVFSRKVEITDDWATGNWLQFFVENIASAQATMTLDPIYVGRPFV